MRRMMSWVVVGSVALAASLVQAQAPASRSAAAAAALVSLMTTQGLQAAAAGDPTEPGRFVAALSFPGTQLLVVSARYPVPAAVEVSLAKREFQEVYMNLQSHVTTEGRFFVQDMQADGLKALPRDGEAFDSVYENGVTGMTFDGDWTRHDMSEASYRAKFQAADRRYAEILAVLVAALRTDAPAAADSYDR